MFVRGLNDAHRKFCVSRYEGSFLSEVNQGILSLSQLFID
jgi:hypothetical protein